MLPTLQQFLDQKHPTNSYIDYPGLELYARKGIVAVSMNDEFFRCQNTFTIAKIGAHRPGQGMFAKLIEDLLSRDLAIYIENVHSTRFAGKLEREGYQKVNLSYLVPCFLRNFEGHLEKWEN